MAAAIHHDSSLLRLPAALDVKIEDIVEFDLGTGTTKSATPSETGPGLLLVAKACDALINLGYDDVDVRKVAHLMARNLMTVSSTQVENGPGLERHGEQDQDRSGIDGVGREVGILLQGLLDKNTPRSRSVHVNSNEPVVLVNRSGSYDQARFGRVVDEAVTQLQQKWNIWPVRVYGGPCVEPAEEGFSITLLNVVNTDIGGPSMVQLLDASCSAPEWSCFTRREAWRERDLLYREDLDVPDTENESIQDDASERSLHSDGDASLDSPSLSPVQSYAQKQTSPVGEKDLGGDGVPTSSALDDDAPDQEIPTQDVGELALAEPERKESRSPQPYVLPETNVKHPTWQRHDDSVSLLDLIKAQVSALTPSGKGDDGPDAGPDKAAKAAGQEQAGTAAEDEYVVL